MEEYLELIADILEIELSKNDLDTKLIDIEEWDSIAGLGLMVKADENYKIAITPDQLENALTLRDLVKLLEVGSV